MGQRLNVGTKSELEKLQGGKLVEAGGRSIAVFCVEGECFAIDNICTHKGGPLAEGILEGHRVTCPWHGAEFDVKSGEVLAGPARNGVRSFPVHVSGEEVEIEVD